MMWRGLVVTALVSGATADTWGADVGQTAAAVPRPVASAPT